MSAVAYEAFRHDSSFQEQEGQHAEEKRRIGLAAAELVKDGETIGLTPGTTATQVARSLRHRKGITVVTSTVNVAMELCNREDLTVYVTGGYLRGGWFSLVGARAASGVREVFLDKVFLGVNAIDAERGLTCLHPEEAAINRALVGQARERIVVADRSKLGRVVRCLICPTSEVHVLITDRDATDDEVRPFRDRDIEVRARMSSRYAYLIAAVAADLRPPLRVRHRRHQRRAHLPAPGAGSLDAGDGGGHLEPARGLRGRGRLRGLAHRPPRPQAHPDRLGAPLRRLGGGRGGAAQPRRVRGGAASSGGLAIGVASVLAPLYIAEISPRAIRGRLVSLNQMAIVTGILLAYFVNWLLSFGGPLELAVDVRLGRRPVRRLLRGAPLRPRVAALPGREGSGSGGPRGARARGRGAQAQGELAEIRDTLAQEAGTLRELFEKRLRKPLGIAVFLAVFQQITGINTVIYYGSVIFKEHVGGQSDSAAIGANVVIGSVNFLMTIVALWTIDRLGRRPLMMLASGGMAVSLFLLGFLFRLAAAPRAHDPGGDPALRGVLRRGPRPRRVGGDLGAVPHAHPRAGDVDRDALPVAGLHPGDRHLPLARRGDRLDRRLLGLRGDERPQPALRLAGDAGDEGAEPRGDRAVVVRRRAGRRWGRA